MGKNNSAPIGIFDSGVGGLTVARSVIDQLPNENIVYIGDSANTPYGDKPFEDVRGFSKAITDDLILRGCKVIVIACNTATAAFEDQAKELYDVPVLEVITPAVRRALAATHSGKIGVIGTQGTIDSEAYQKTFEGLADPDQTIEVYAASCPQFAPFVERGVTSGPQILSLAESYLEPLKQQGIDTLVLGCTHYPLLTGVISIVMGDEVTLVSSAEETAKDVYKTLNELDLLNQPSEQAAVDSSPAAQTGGSYTFESTGDPQRFAQLAHRFLGPSIMSPLEMER